MKDRMKRSGVITLSVVGLWIGVGSGRAVAAPCLTDVVYSDLLLVINHANDEVFFGCIAEGDKEANLSVRMFIGGPFKPNGRGRANILDAGTGIESDRVTISMDATGMFATITMRSDSTKNEGNAIVRDMFGGAIAKSFNVTEELFKNINPKGLAIPITVFAQSDTPEPTSLALFGVGLFVLALRQRIISKVRGSGHKHRSAV